MHDDSPLPLLETVRTLSRVTPHEGRVSATLVGRRDYGLLLYLGEYQTVENHDPARLCYLVRYQETGIDTLQEHECSPWGCVVKF